MNDLDERLIRIVSEHKELYDTNHAAYSNIKLKKQIWQNIGKMLDIPGDVCKKKWRNIRDSYRKNMKDQENEKYKKRYKYASILEFLNPPVHDKIVISSYCTEEENPKEFVEDSVNESDHGTEDIDQDDVSTGLDLDEGDSRSEGQQTLRKKRVLNESNVLLSCMPEEAKIKISRRSEDEDDPLKQLFCSMYSTMKTFPPLLQTETKMKLFGIISNAELEYLKSKEGGFPSVTTSFAT